MEIIEATIEHRSVIYEFICELENETLDKDNINNPDVHYLLAMDGLNVIGFESLHIQKLII